MHVAFIELLRCPRPHAESALVAAAREQRERRIIHGTLGCPLCGASFSIRAGVADLRASPPADALATATTVEPPNENSVVRLAAQLDLTEGGRLVLLFGQYARIAPPLTVAFDAHVLAINPPVSERRHIAEHASVLLVDSGVPLARSTVHGAAVDSNHAAQLGLTDLVQALRPNGRLVAPRAVDVPADVSLLAADDSEWVVSKAAPVIRLQRGGTLRSEA